MRFQEKEPLPEIVSKDSPVYHGPQWVKPKMGYRFAEWLDRHHEALIWIKLFLMVYLLAFYVFRLFLG